MRKLGTPGSRALERLRLRPCCKLVRPVKLQMLPTMKIGLMAQSLQGLVELPSHRLVMEPRLGH